MANDATSAERTLNGSIELEPTSITDAVAHDSEPADTSARREDDADTVDEESASAHVTDEQPATRNKPSGFRHALAMGLTSLLALAGVCGWLGYGLCEARQTDQLRNHFLAVGRQGALNLTTINYSEADADVQRVLDSTTGQFHDEFSKRAPAFIDVVKQAQSRTRGSITDAGVESIGADSARVIVAVAVNTSNLGGADQPVRHWRMRIDVQKVGDTVKVSNVGFVP